MIVSAAATLHGSRALWYLTRGSGVVAIVLLSLGVVLGIVTSTRLHAPGWPRFLLAELHRNISYVVVGVLLVHIVTAVLDTFAPIGWLDAFVPLHSSYRPVWLGLGAVAFDLFLVVLITSLLRVTLGYARWRALHWAVYPAWAAAVVHGLGTGSDTKTSWVLLVTVLCVLGVLAALVWRLASGWPGYRRLRIGLGVTAAVGTLLLAGWVRTGPLQAGWARAAGTPPSLLASSHTAAGGGSGGSGSGKTGNAGSATSSTPALDRPFSDSLRGRLTQAALGTGQVRVTLPLTATGGVPGQLVIVIDGQPAAGGGVAETASRVTFTPTGSSTRLTGQLSSLDGDRLTARVSSATRAVSLDITLTIGGSGAVTGSLAGSPG